MKKLCPYIIKKKNKQAQQLEFIFYIVIKTCDVELI